MAKGLFGGLFGGQGLQMVGKLTKQNMEKLQASLENPVGLYFSDCFPPKFFLYSSIKNFSL